MQAKENHLRWLYYREAPATSRGLFVYNVDIMSYSAMIIQDSPIGFWPGQQSAGVLPELTGLGGTGDGTIISSIDTKPVAAQSGGGQRVSGSGFTVEQTRVFIEGMESRPFSLEAWIKTENDSGDNWIFARDFSGIEILGDTIVFKVMMDSDLSIFYTGIKVGEVYHVVLTYDTSAFVLYLNGVLVGSVAVSSDDLIAGFDDTTTDYAFRCPGGAFSTDSIAIYGRALNNSDIQRHYEAGTNYLDILSLNPNEPATKFKFDDSRAGVKIKKVFDSSSSWADGYFTNTVLVGDAVGNAYDSTLDSYLAGTWQYLLHLDPESDFLDAGRINWELDDYSGLILFDISSDGGATWTSLDNNSSPVPVGMTLTSGVDLIIRASFDASDAQILMHWLSVVLYKDRSARAINSDTIADLNTSSDQFFSEFDYEPSAFKDKDGFISGSTTDTRIEVAPDLQFGDCETAEFIIKVPGNPVSGTILGGDAGTLQPKITLNSSGQWVASNLIALYIDGVSVSVTSPVTVTPDVFHYVVAEFDPFSFVFYIGDGVEIILSYLALHYDTLSANDIQIIYDALVGKPAERVTDENVINITEHDLGEGPVKAYSFVWSLR